ncbi:MAG: hypothetical protein A2654_00820 [Candidatus Nealsonbacteria bacterium RIFCSPHIGHO2_01_FULL_43_31]|uniref:DUF5671 domain-containing protein n=2 Tax=Candidatus Nealsoniibacteriota TaxID=1817911 RepID=A0A1G2E729_9BACT|nr:MAG: hypothetical protein A2654_00820 [Candidatus Nealsonbacteria bacterium RIFCSPHIGHO2_01_FULL_43_31]OGZ21140.1 MAG: hypothetical protein A3D46_02500 [Candidatus Nealsonbacteria bacterium RIFCSPHIGHO2_02_FULL_43_13]OGZ24441.1 MAG: hypothetical protein A2922_00300 [Candidatus Nealsonbacteria bacterium RIFCSPLOWO2_01_FULL_43_36]
MNNNINRHNAPRDVFLYLLNILTFYLSVIGFIMLYIQYISAAFPDPLNFYYTAIANAVRVSTSIFIVAVPVFILTSFLLAKDLKSNPEKREGRLRKWLIYLTLFISSVTIIVNLIIFVYNFMSGELTIQFFLKILTVLLVALAVFGYYIWELRRKDAGASKIPKMLAWALSVIVVASIVVGFFVIGTPAEQRAKRFDEQRVGDLQVLQNQVVNYWVQKQVLPASLNDLQDSISGFLVPQDPASGAAYEYRIASPLSFELCAIFKTSTKDFKVAYKGARSFYIEPVYYGSSFQQNWDHEAERTCFTRTIDPELYKPKQIPAL